MRRYNPLFQTANSKRSVEVIRPQIIQNTINQTSDNVVIEKLNNNKILIAMDDKITSSHYDINAIFNDVYKNINIYFVDKTAPGELIKTGIDAMLQSLDPYTNYIPESNIEDYRMMQTGQYGGIGSLIKQQGDYVVISDPYDNFPAQKAGLKAGDKILEIMPFC